MTALSQIDFQAMLAELVALREVEEAARKAQYRLRLANDEGGLLPLLDAALARLDAIRKEVR